MTAQTQVSWLGCPTMNPFSLDPPNLGCVDADVSFSWTLDPENACSSMVLLGSVAVNLTVVAPIKKTKNRNIRVDI